MKKTIIFILVSVFISSACEKIIDINVPEKDRKIVLNSLINPDDPFSVQLSRRKSVLEDDEMSFLDDAVVKVSKGNTLLGTMTYDVYGRYILEGILPEIGEQYNIEVEHPVLQPVSSQVKIPEYVPILEIDTSRSFDEYGYPRYKLNMRFEDPHPEDSYFSVSMLLTERIYDWQTETFLDSTQTYNVHMWLSGYGGNNIGGELLEQQPSFYMDGKLFIHDAPLLGADNMLELGLEYNVYSFMQDSVEIQILLDHIDPSYYKYARSREMYYRTNESPFAEPVKVFNNIEGGFGIFSSYARSRRTYKLYVSGER